jgi:hypothetical protein
VKKIMMLLAVTMLLLGVSGQAMAAFENGDLIRVVYSGTGSGIEYATDLGNFASLTSPGSAPIILNTNNFNLSSFGGATFDQMYVAYFMVTTTGGQQVWTSGPSTGETGGGRNGYSKISSPANTVTGAYQVAGGGAANATLSQSDPNSYWNNLNAGGSTTGLMKGFITVGNADQSLAALSTTGYVDQVLYYYSTPGSAHDGVGVVSLRTYADGHTGLNTSAVPVPPSVLLLGSGLLGLVGIGRKRTV